MDRSGLRETCSLGQRPALKPCISLDGLLHNRNAFAEGPSGRMSTEALYILRDLAAKAKAQ